MKHKPIAEQVVVVLGAASGIGRETALRFASRGAKVVVADNDAGSLETLVAEISGPGGTAISVLADTADFAQVSAVAEAAVREFGRLDSWIQVAAVGIWAPFMDTTIEEFKRIIDVDLMGQVYGAKAALPYLVDNGGALVHVSSIEARRALPFHAPYSAAKHGVDGFLEALRMELRKGKVPVSVTEILPSTINTPFFNKSISKIGVKPMGIPPFYDPGIVANAILHAAVHPHREIVVGGAGKGLLTLQRISPSLVDGLMLLAGFGGQETNEPKGADAPNNLYAPVGDDRVRGDFGKFAFRHSISTWLDLHPAVKSTAILGGAIGAAAWMRGRGSSGETLDRPPMAREEFAGAKPQDTGVMPRH
jgi:NAD(P)-dependent dehydrogenase (short-subunit alcohol dehydrogenase family)